MRVGQRSQWMDVVRVFVFALFPAHLMLVLSIFFLTFPNHSPEYRPLKWTKEGKCSLTEGGRGTALSAGGGCVDDPEG